MGVIESPDRWGRKKKHRALLCGLIDIHHPSSRCRNLLRRKGTATLNIPVIAAVTAAIAAAYIHTRIPQRNLSPLQEH